MENSTELLTENRGWIRVSDATVTDRIFHPNGHPINIIYVGPARLGKICYRATTVDNRSIVVNAERLWAVTDKRRERRKGRRHEKKARTFEAAKLSSQEIFMSGTSRYTAGSRSSTAGGKSYTTNEYRFVLPNQRPITLSDVELPIDPYLFGAWLGDGNTGGASMTCAANELEYWQSVISTAGYLPTVHRGSRPGVAHLGITVPLGVGRQSRSFGGKIRRLGLLDHKAIPDIYLVAGTTQREALLQGLLDTDGTIEAKRGQVEFCSTNRNLAEGALFLARSLGWRATLVTHRATLNGVDFGAKYRVCWTPTQSDPFSPFRMPRKALRVKSIDGGKGRATISIAKMERTQSVPVQSIAVDSPDGLFLAGRSLVPIMQHPAYPQWPRPQ